MSSIQIRENRKDKSGGSVRGWHACVLSSSPSSRIPAAVAGPYHRPNGRLVTRDDQHNQGQHESFCFSCLQLFANIAPSSDLDPLLATPTLALVHTTAEGNFQVQKTKTLRWIQPSIFRPQWPMISHYRVKAFSTRFFWQGGTTRRSALACRFWSRLRGSRLQWWVPAAALSEGSLPVTIDITKDGTDFWKKYHLIQSKGKK